MEHDKRRGAAFYSPIVRQIHQASSCQSCVYLGGLQTVPAPGCVYTTRSTSIQHPKPHRLPRQVMSKPSWFLGLSAEGPSHNDADEFVAAKAKPHCIYRGERSDACCRR